MIARFDHHPMLTELSALTTAVLVVVVITLATLLITAPPAATPTTTNANPAAVSGAGSSDYAQDPSTVAFERHPDVVAALSE